MHSLKFLPPVIAHRGGSVYAPENTMIALSKAASFGASWVEFDVMLSACGETILFHDETLERTTNGVGLVADFPYAYLHTLDAGAWFDSRFAGECIPTLSQALIFLKEMGLSANIEIKPAKGQDERTVVRVLEVVERIVTDPHSILFSSFSLIALRLLRRLLPSSQVGFLMDPWLKDWRGLCDELQCVSLHVNEAQLTAARVHEVKNAGLLLLSYTVNDPKRIKELLAWGVDAVFSDDLGVI